MNNIIVGCIAILSGYLGYRYGLIQMKTKIHLDFIERQLRDFYAPLIGYRKKILAVSGLRTEINKVSENKYRESYKEDNKPSEEEKKKYDNSIEYSNQQFREQLMPIYDKMVLTFTDNYYMAETHTRKYYDELIMYVEIWHRKLSNAIALEVVKELNHTEEKLKPFYEDLEEQMEKLSKKIPGK